MQSIEQSEPAKYEYTFVETRSNGITAEKINSHAKKGWRVVPVDFNGYVLMEREVPHG